MIEKLISGGKTGVDRGGLDWAMENGVACGGFCPKGRRAEDGRIPSDYSGLVELIKQTIISKAKALDVYPIDLETALYEEDFEEYNQRRLQMG